MILLLATALAQDSDCGAPVDCPDGATCDCSGVCIDLPPQFEVLSAADTELRGYGNSRGVNMNDFNGDGRLDLFVAQAVSRIDGGPTWPGDDLLFLAAEGELEFEEVGGAFGVDDGCENRSPMFGDLDNDGLPDLFVTTNGVPVVYHNEEWGYYRDYTAFAGDAWTPGWGHQGFLFDYDLDGFLDVFWTNGPEDGSGKNILLRNQRDGTFRDTSVEAGVAGVPSGKGTCVLDVNVDGLPDIFVTTGREWGNSLFINQGDGTFRDEAAERGAYDAWQRFGVGVDCADYDNDGDPDILVITHDRAYTGNLLYVNYDGYFRDDAERVGVMEQIDGHGSAWLDLDLDGWLDITMSGIKTPPYLFQNQRDGTMLRVCDGWGVSQDDGITWANAGADYTGDGYPEVYIANGLGRRPRDDEFFLNLGGSNHYLTVKVTGVSHNPSQLGAKVEVDAGGFTQTRWVGTWSSFDSQGPLPLTFGLGDATVVDEVRVSFTNGTVVTETGVAADQSIEIIEPIDFVDSDHDGKPDAWDACPGTRLHQRTDGEGCAPGQRRGVGVALVSPADADLLIAPPTFEWTTEPGVSSVLQISVDGTFGPAGRFDFGPFEGNAYTPTEAEWRALQAAQPVQRPMLWRVVVAGEEGAEGVSPARQFSAAVETSIVHVPMGVNYFEPAHIVVDAGTSVTWWNDSVAAGNLQNEPHDVQIVGEFGEPFTYMNTLEGAGYFTYTFNEPGKWFFICHRHSGMGNATDHVPESLSFHRGQGPYRCMAGSVVVR